MPRDVFPYPEDRELIEYFLRGKARTPDNTDSLVLFEGRLSIKGAAGAPTIAWFDTAGALTVQLTHDLNCYWCYRVINEIRRQMGIEDRVITREEKDQVGWIDRFNTFIDGAPIQLNQPIVLVGPLGVLAWREGIK